jgi:hypothetical protein
MKRRTQRTVFRSGAALGVILGFLVAPAVHAQARLQAEYRIDSGAPQAMAGVASESRTEYWEGEFTASVSASNLSVGPHYLEVRMQGSNGVWCEWQGQWFRIAGETHLVAAEWFTDTDPGWGLGRPIPLPEDGAWDEREEDFLISNVSVTNLAEGRHTLVMRAKDSNGDWGITSEAVFYVASPLYLTAAVWTTNPLDWGNLGDTPPATNSMQAVDRAFDEAEEDVIASVNTLALGANYCMTRPIYVRVQDSWGRWSTRGGLLWNPTSNTWAFASTLGWSSQARAVLTVAPEMAANPAPGDHCLTVITNGYVTLDWRDCKGISGYHVVLCGDLTGGYASLISSNDYTNSAITVGPLANGTYSWMVSSLGGSECSKNGAMWQFSVTSPQAGDADHDGIPDDWERRYFPSLATANGTTDRDGDGCMDWQEYVCGTVPTNRSDFCPVPRCASDPSGVVLEWETVQGRSYIVYYATNVLEMNTPWMLFDQLPGSGSTLRSTNTWPDPAGFYKVGVSAPGFP